MIFDSSVRQFDYFDYVRLVPLFYNREGLDAKITIRAPNGVSLMGYVPHKETNRSINLFLKSSFFNPYAKDQ